MPSVVVDPTQLLAMFAEGNELHLRVDEGPTSNAILEQVYLNGRGSLVLTYREPGGLSSDAVKQVKISEIDAKAA